MGGGEGMIGGGGYNLRASAHRFGPPTVAYLALLVDQNVLLFCYISSLLITF